MQTQNNNLGYAVRGIGYIYNGEDFELDPNVKGASEGVFSSLEEAQLAKDRLEIQATKEEIYFFRLSPYVHEENLNRIVKFLNENQIDGMDGQQLRLDFPDLLTDEQLLKMLNFAELERFEIVSLDQDKKEYYVIWINYEQKYLTDQFIDKNDAIVFASNIDDLFVDANAYLVGHYFESHGFGEGTQVFPRVLTGSLSALSDTPTLLENFINNELALIYNHERLTLTIQFRDLSRHSFIEFNKLLKQPLVEIRHLSLHEILQIESDRI